MNGTAGSDNHDDQTDFADLGSNYADSSFPGYPQALIIGSIKNLKVGFRRPVKDGNELHLFGSSLCTKLPEDCHYQLEDFVKLFLLPNVKCLGRRARKFSDGPREQCNDYGSSSSWDEEVSVGVTMMEMFIVTLRTLAHLFLSLASLVNKIEVQCNKTSKQVDVQALKYTLWGHIQEYAQLPLEGQKETVSLRKILANFRSECNAAETIKDISPHLCVIFCCIWLMRMFWASTAAPTWMILAFAFLMIVQL